MTGKFIRKGLSNKEVQRVSPAVTTIANISDAG